MKMLIFDHALWKIFGWFINSFIFYSTTKHEIIQINDLSLLCSMAPPNQSRLFKLVDPLLANEN